MFGVCVLPERYDLLCCVLCYIVLCCARVLTRIKFGMNYKRIFKTRASRSRLLQKMGFLPDRTMLKLQYFIKHNRVLHLKNPVRFTEKLQWYKLNYRNPIMHQCVDKYEVREFVRSKGLENILVKLYGCYETVDEVEWDKLPTSFIAKRTFGGGGYEIYLVKNSDPDEIEQAKKVFAYNPGNVGTTNGGREWAYYGLKRRVVFEELLINEDKPEAGIDDYKIFCYSGKAKYIVYDTDRYIDHRRNFYDREWNDLKIESDCKACKSEIPKPENLDGMLKIAEKLSEDFPYVRVDLYNIKGKIYFGELTFYPWSGYVQYSPDSADFLFGEDFELRKYTAE